jgi:hypothetical protein
MEDIPFDSRHKTFTEEAIKENINRPSPIYDRGLSQLVIMNNE